MSPRPSRIRARSAFRASRMSVTCLRLPLMRTRTRQNPARQLRTELWQEWLAPGVVHSLVDKPTHSIIRSEGQCTPVGLQCLVVAAEPRQHVGSSEVERRILVQCASALDVLEQSKALDRTDCEGNGNCPIQLDDRCALVTQQLFVQDCNLSPIGVRCRRCLGMNRRNRALDLIGPGPPHPKGAFDEPNALLDLRAVPLVAVLILEKHEIAVIADASLTP